MKIPGGEHINQCIHFLNQSSATFKKWWNEPRKESGLSRKDEFQQLFQEKRAAFQNALGSLEKYLKTTLESRDVRVSEEAPVETKKAPVPEGAVSKVVAELDAVLKEYSARPLPKAPSQTFPKAMHLPNKPLPALPKSQRPLPPIPDEEPPPLPSRALAPTDETKPARVIPPRRKPPERTNKTLGNPKGAPSKIAPSKTPIQTVKGPSEAQNQDISRMMQALVKMRMDKAVVRDILLGDKGTLSSNPERQLRAIRILKERGIIEKNTSELPALDSFARDKTIELLSLLEDNERKLQANVDSWYEKNGGGIRF